MGAQVRVLDWPTSLEDLNGTALWDAVAIARAVRGTANAQFQASGVEIDSRDVVPGDLFFALKGESTDGHRFLQGAFEKGAAAAVVDRPVDYPHVLVRDTNAALEALAKAARERSAARIVGVTGSVGKTGVKEALFLALDRSSRGAAHRSVKSYNNHVGVPLSLARMSSRAKFGVFEMGMNHAGEISALTAQVRPHVALVTTVAPAHIENLGSEEAIADAKAEIFEGLEPGGVAIIPADNRHCARLKAAAEARGAQIVSFGAASHADVRLLDAVDAPGGGSLVTADMGDRRVCYTVSAPGEHWIANSLAVMAAVRAAGGDLGAAGVALGELPGLAGRGARTDIAAKGGSAILIDESYNANPASMRATLAQLGQTPARRRIAVLGAMKELGDFTPSFHAALADPIAEADVDFVVLVGDEMAALAEELGKPERSALGKALRFAHCADVEQAGQAVREFGLERGDAILVKGSNSVGLSALVTSLARQED
ncbi:UDP-N-acetylmuramoyl-tripeptide--D-alanyl-D-alanine ligase [Novosphingobium marinum]|uniref:UDP-N-acetylmuramoyl-tripeptide--D-alanyl-D-alanine ligase n=1 Tax=Novosphingobium marinum TaxID=1514948 RepID=A0A7Y9XV89_9SPHN|nr:UDP-N-acetylmuramoyl-tripeptide--D-alanyl-D-alanine ligase [Novosphingobium marinum]NYH95246.1 UDP-N-acetylmuramoyl-tripeptide--D-alanyl-D-alanine ligase [Novosphingobium marinum]GGC25495.1 UDP-N-acetylmuramoyl-tripeptide--D-alanyl-D-alanine ligase [Novosphingobium marinum]